MIPLSMIRRRLSRHLGLLLSVAACAAVVGTQARMVSQRGNDQEFMTKLGLESAWPHVRADFAR